MNKYKTNVLFYFLPVQLPATADGECGYSMGLVEIVVKRWQTKL